MKKIHTARRHAPKGLRVISHRGWPNTKPVLRVGAQLVGGLDPKVAVVEPLPGVGEDGREHDRRTSPATSTTRWPIFSSLQPCAGVSIICCVILCPYLKRGLSVADRWLQGWYCAADEAAAFACAGAHVGGGLK